MNVFVAGVHGVGKTYLASHLPPGSGLNHTSASKLIREERDLPTWGADKRVADVEENQVALAAAVARHNAEGTALLLDGHFVLLNQDRKFMPLGAEVFKSLHLSAVILVEAPADVVASRLSARDGGQPDPVFLEAFMAKERSQAHAVCGELRLPLHVLISPSDAEFEAAVQSSRQQWQRVVPST